jgi:ligand-binding sensor domain-containing protein/serine phosphatase RsbU (regulator of sigma subunit)
MGSINRIRQMDKKYFVVFCFILFILFNPFSLQADGYKSKYFTSEKGLAQDYVQNIVQDDRGFLWLGTNNGLSRFDGMQFVNFLPKDTAGNSYDVSSSFKDSRGIIWFGLNNGGILKIADKTPQLITPDKPLTSSVNGISESGGAIWFASQTNGILRMDSTGKTTLFAEAFKEVLVFSILADGDNILVGTNEGLLGLKYDNASSSLNIKGWTFDNIPSTKILFLSKQDGFIYVGTEDEGLFILEIKNGKPELKAHYTAENGIASNDVQSVLIDKEKNLWIASFGKGISKVIFKDNSQKEFEVKHYNTSNGLKNDFIRDIIQDHERNIWVATYGSGIAMLNEDISTRYFSNISLRSANIQTIIKDKRGYFWLGTDKGVSRISSNGVEHSVVNYSTAQGFPGDLVNALYEDIEGNIWIGTSNSGLFQYTPSTNSARKIQLSDDPLFRFVNSISGDKLGFVWVSTKGGAYRFGTNGFRLDYFTTLQGLLHNNVNKVFADSKNRIWMAAQNNRISYFKDSRFHYLEEGSAAEITTVNCITEDEDKNIWFGTDGKGIFVYDGKNAEQYTSANGLYSDFCYDIISDNYDNVWIGHRGGISIFSKKTKTFKHLIEAGLNDNINTNAVYKDKEGILWFGTTNGAVKYDPSLHISSAFENKVTITSLKLLNELVDMEPKLALPYKKYSARFEFVAVSFSRPEKIQYKYKLEGYNTEWSEPSNTPYAYYPKLEEGNYKFMVLASNADGIWSTTPEVFEFSIAKPIYKRWWFILLFTALVFGSIYGVIRYRTYKLLSDKEELEKLVKERTVEVVAQKEEIEKNRDEIQRNVKNITDSIKYAKRIQRAIFPANSDIKKLLPDSFVFFRSKSIVSGDFYWVEKKDDKVLFAAVDCTGHGVPGAFMSLVANNLLNQAITEHGLTKPASILDEVNSGLTNTLHQTYEESSVKDGMDIALCALDTQKMILEYAGAYNPVFIVRKGELIETKANKFPIGVFVGEKLKKFTNHTIELKKGDAIYVFSDGFADQFGGPFIKKFKKREFKNMLMRIANMSMNEQLKEIEKTLDEWQGSNEQVDDIVVIGVRV